MAQSHYVFIESRDPFESADAGFVTEMATVLRQEGRPVTVFLVQNGVLATRAGARGSHVPRLTEVYVVQEDLDGRGIARAGCVTDAHAIPRREVAALMEQHDQVWHW
ncbi:MAG: DsrH/TusB family sulfur metabolism protein [Candidatus Rokuibacteriota bacterium]